MAPRNSPHGSGRSTSPNHGGAADVQTRRGASFASKRDLAARHRRGRTAVIGEALERRSLFTAITSFSLIDATTDRPVPGYESLENGAIINLRGLPGRLLNLVANADSTTDSVRFSHNDRIVRTDKAQPYAVFGEVDGDFAAGALAPGQHKVAATPYAPMVGRTTLTAREGATQAVTFTVVDRPVVTLSLYDADTDQPIAGHVDLRPGATIDLATLPTRNLTIRAGGEALSAGKVEFAFDNLPTRTEFVAPFALFGDDGDGELFGGALSVGTHTLVVRTASTGNATRFDSETRTPFTVIDSRSAKATFVPTNAWTGTFNAAGTRPTFGVNGGKIKTSASTATVQLNGRTLDADEFVLKSGSVRLLVPLEPGENLVELSVRSAADRTRVRGSFALWAGSTTVAVSADGATQGVNIVATLDGAPVASETYIPAGGSGLILSAPEAPISLDGADVDDAQDYSGDVSAAADEANVRPTTSTTPRPTHPTTPRPTPDADGALKIYTTIFSAANTPDAVVPGTTPIVTDGGAGIAFGLFVDGGLWLEGGWDGPHEEVDEVALRRYMDALPVGTVYLSNSFEDQLDTRLEQITTVLRAAHERGLTVGWYGLPGLRFAGTLSEWQAAHDVAMESIAPYLDWITPAYYFADTSRQIPAYLKEMLGESVAEASRLAGTRPIVPTISPYTHDGRAVPISTTLELVRMFRDRGISQVTVWTDRGLTAHVQATLDALAAA